MSITRKQLFTLFTANVIFWTILQGLVTMLPVYALELGADPASIGNYLGFAFFAMTVGGVTAGWLADRFQRRKRLLTAAILANIPVSWLMSQAASFEQLVIVTGIVHFLASVGFGMIVNLVGLSAGEAERGSVFGAMGVTGPLGAVVAGSVSGVIVNRWGFSTLFFVVALGWALALLIVLFAQDKTVAPTAPAPDTRPALNALFYTMLIANLFAFGCGFLALLGRSIQMVGLDFDPEAISGVVAIGGAVAIPLPFLLGWLSDRISRYYVVAFCFLAGAIGLFTLAGSNLLWHFAASSVLLTTVGASIGISQALVTDLVAPKSLGVALSLYGSAATIGGIFGFTGAGHAIQTFGLTPTYIAATIVTLVAAAVIIWLKFARQKRQALAEMPA